MKVLILKVMKKLIILLVAVLLLVPSTFSQNFKIPLIGSTAPSFTAETTNGTLNFPDDFGKKWKMAKNWNT